MLACVRDDAEEGGDELDDLGERDEDLVSGANATQCGGIVQVHEDVDESVEPHANDAEGEAEMEPSPYLHHDGRVVPHVQQGKRAPTYHEQHGIS